VSERRFPVTVDSVGKAAEIVSEYFITEHGGDFIAWMGDYTSVARLGAEGNGVVIYWNHEEPKRVDYGRIFPHLKDGLRWALREEFGELGEGRNIRVTCGPESRCVTEQNAQDGCDVDIVNEEGELEYGTSWCIY